MCDNGLGVACFPAVWRLDVRASWLGSQECTFKPWSGEIFPRDPGIFKNPSPHPIMACPSYQPERERLSPSHMTLHCPAFVPLKSLSLNCFHLFNPPFIRLHPLTWLWRSWVCWVPSYHRDPWASSPLPAVGLPLWSVLLMQLRRHGSCSSALSSSVLPPVPKADLC